MQKIDARNGRFFLAVKRMRRCGVPNRKRSRGELGKKQEKRKMRWKGKNRKENRMNVQ